MKSLHSILFILLFLITVSCQNTNKNAGNDSTLSLQLEPVWVVLADETGAIDRDNYFASVEMAVFSPDKKLVASAAKQGKNLMLWDVANQSVVWETITDDFNMAVLFIDNGQKLISAGYDGMLWVWDTNTGALIDSVIFNHPIETMRFIPTQNIVAVGDKGGILTLLSAENFELINRVSHGPDMDVHPGPDVNSDIISMAYTSNGKILATAGYSSNILLWETNGLNFIKKLTGHSSTVKELVFSPCNKFLFSVSASLGEWSDGDNTLRCWDVESGKEVFKQNFPFGLETVAVTPNGKFLFVGSKEGKNYEDPLGGIGHIMVFALPENLKTQPPKLVHKERVFRQEFFDFTADGKYLLSSHDDGTIRLWSILYTE